uniref:Uncharacterized protein n=1 Tax=Anguilla anguilla TaxID=7936 RepID=A0A0E9SF37_ANGAN
MEGSVIQLGTVCLTEVTYPPPRHFEGRFGAGA